jgi:hypothetical protein
MKVAIRPDGQAGAMSGQCTDPIFLEPSRACLTPQTYLPALKRGRPVRSTGEIVVEYRLQVEPDPISSFLSNLFPKAEPEVEPLPKPEPDICKPRPDDLIAGLGRLREG